MDIRATKTLASGHEIPIIGYGTYETTLEITEEVVSHALKAGYRQIDTAAFYNNEDGCGRAILNSGLRREDLFFVTKLAPGNMGYDATKDAIRSSLERSGLSYIDLFLVHAPFGNTEARNGSWQAMAEAVVEGKNRSIGVSNYGLHHLRELEQFRAQLPSELKAVPLSVAQYELHPWMPRKALVQYAKDRNIVLQAFGPVALGKKSNDPELLRIAAKHGKTWAQVLIRWSIQKGFVPLPKSTTEARIKENLEVFDFCLDPLDMEALETDAYELNRAYWDPVKWGLHGP